MKYDIGCGVRKRKGHIGVDSVKLPSVEIVCDLKQFPWPLESDSAEAIFLGNVIEHLPDIVGTMNELHRVSKRSAKVRIIYPYYKSKGAYGDPTHVHWLNEYMIDYFLEPGSVRSRENAYSFYTDKYWNLTERRLTTYPFLSWIPQSILAFLCRHTGLDIVHSVYLEISPKK